MTIEITHNSESPDFGSKEIQESIVNAVKDNWDNGRKDRAKREEVWMKCWKAFSMYINSDLYPDQPWRNNFTLAWSFQAARSGASEIKNILMPNDENFFKIKAVNNNNEQQVINSEVMTKYLKRKFKKGNFVKATNLFLKQAAIIGCSAMKVYWKQRWDMDHVNKVEYLSFDAPYAEFIKMQDFVVYPANSSDISESMQIQRVYRHISDVKGMDQSKNEYGIYVNTDQIEVNTSMTYDAGTSDNAFSKQVASILGINEPKAPKGQVELLEAWGDFTIEGKMYRNYVATIVNKKHLIRFQPNPYERKPFIFASLDEVPGSAYGQGFIEPGLQTQSLAEMLDNMMMDELLLKIHGQFKYVEDGVFDPDNFEIRPGGMHPVKEMNNLQRIDNAINLNTPLTVKEGLKAEFEETTGVLKYSKGADAGQAHTATEADLLTQGSSKNFTSIAKALNETYLEPAVELFYTLVRQFGDEEDIAKYTGVDPQMIDRGIPMSDMDIDITGLSTVLDKQQDIQNIERLFTNMAQLPAGAMINQEVLVEDYLRAIGFDDPERYMMPTEIRQAVQQSIVANATAALQQQMMMQQQAEMAQQQQPQLPPGSPNAVDSPDKNNIPAPGSEAA